MSKTLQVEDIWDKEEEEQEEEAEKKEKEQEEEEETGRVQQKPWWSLRLWIQPLCPHLRPSLAYDHPGLCLSLTSIILHSCFAQDKGPSPSTLAELSVEANGLA